MSDELPPPSNNKTYSITIEDAEHIEKESLKQVLAIEELISYYLEEDPDRRHALSLLCEGYHLNYKLFLLLKRVLKNSERFFPEDTSKEEIIVSPTDMMMLQTATIARYYLSIEMSRTENISTCFH